MTTTDDDRSPDDAAAELERDLRACAAEHGDALDAALRHLEAAVEEIEAMRAAAARHRRRRVEAEALEDAADVEVDVPEIDRLDLSHDGARHALHDARDAVSDALDGETPTERRARGAGLAWNDLRTAGGPDEVRRLVRRLRDRLDDPGWLTDDVARDCWIAPAEDRERELRERAVADRALRWCASAWRGRTPGDPADVFPEPVAEIVTDFVETGAMAAGNAGWRVPRRWYPAYAEVPPGDRMGERDLEEEIEDAVAALDDAALDRAHPDVASPAYAGTTRAQDSDRSRPATS